MKFLNNINGEMPSSRFRSCFSVPAAAIRTSRSKFPEQSNSRPGKSKRRWAYRNPGAESYFAENSEFFRVKTAGDLPDGLVWENGDGEKEFASPKAIRGGKEKIWIQDFPRTLRVVGPDSATFVS